MPLASGGREKRPPCGRRSFGLSKRCEPDTICARPGNGAGDRRMKALTLTEYRKFEFGEVPDPEPGPGDVVVAVKACGICGSDIHGMDGSSGRRIPPIIMGHEASGVVHAAGADADAGGWKPGDRVAFDSMISCGECKTCREGRPHLCPERRILGVSCGDYRRHGAFAERVTVPARLLFRIPDVLSFEKAAFGEPVSVALHAVERVGVAPGDVAVVVGAGLIGLLVIQALKDAGCAKVFAVDLDEKRLSVAKELGADEVFLSNKGDVAGEIRARTGGEGADISMEVVGLTPTIRLAIACVRKGGRVGAVGNIQANVEFPLQEIVTREISVMGSCAAGSQYPVALQKLADGSIEVEPLISAKAPLEEGAAWFDRLYRGDEGLLKVILTP